MSSTLSSRVDHLNPAWNDKQTLPDKQFEKAMELVGEEFEGRVKYLYNSWIPARDLVVEAIEGRKEVKRVRIELLFLIFKIGTFLSK